MRQAGFPPIATTENEYGHAVHKECYELRLKAESDARTVKDDIARYSTLSNWPDFIQRNVELERTPSWLNGSSEARDRNARASDGVEPPTRLQPQNAKHQLRPARLADCGNAKPSGKAAEMGRPAWKRLARCPEDLRRSESEHRLRRSSDHSGRDLLRSWQVFIPSKLGDTPERTPKAP